MREMIWWMSKFANRRYRSSPLILIGYRSEATRGTWVLHLLNGLFHRYVHALFHFWTHPDSLPRHQFQQPYPPPLAPSTSSLSQPEDEGTSLPHNLRPNQQEQNSVKRQRLSILPPELPYQLQQHATSLVTNLTPSPVYTHPHPSFLPSSFRTPLPSGTIVSPVASPGSGGGYPYDALGFYGSQHNQLDMQNISQRRAYHGQYNAFMPVLSPPWP